MRALLAILMLSALPAAAQRDPASLPARDQHEGLLVAADPYDDPARAKERFGKKTPLDAGIVPIEVIFRNDNDKPILVELDNIRLLLDPPGGERQQLEPLALEEVLERMLYKHGPEMTMPRKPLPLPRRSSNDKEYRKLESQFRPLVLEMTLVPPKATLRGFLFFHLGRARNWLAHSRLYIPDLKYMHNKQPLFFFEVDLSKAAP